MVLKVAGVVVILLVVCIPILNCCRVSGCNTKEEKEIEDNEQIKYISKHRRIKNLK